MLKTKVALAGNRTPVSRVAGENSTTEPPMLVTSTIFPAQSHIKYCIHVKNKSCIGGNRTPVSRGRQEPPMLVIQFSLHNHYKILEPLANACKEFYH